MSCQYTGHLGGGLCDLPVHDHGVGDLASGTLLGRTFAEPFGDVVVVVAPTPEALGLHLDRGRHEEDQHRVRPEPTHLAGALQIDLEEEVPSGRRVGERRAVQVAEELGPLEEPATVTACLEGRAVDEDVRLVRLSGPARPGRPRAAQPETRIGRDETRGDGPLSGPAGTEEDEDRSFGRVDRWSGWRSAQRAVSRSNASRWLLPSP